MAEQPGRDAETDGHKMIGRPRAYLSKGASGQIAVMFALSMLAIVPALGLIFDGGNIYVQRRTAQNAADAASLAGTRTLMRAFNSPATSIDTNNLIAGAVCLYLTANTFGVIPSGTSTARFVGANGGPLASADLGYTQIPLPTDVTHTLLNCTPAGLAGLPALTIPASATGVHVDATIGPFYTFIAGFLGRGIASGDGAGFAQATATAGSTVQGAAVTSFAADNSPFIVCGTNTRLATFPDAAHPGLHNFPILVAGGPPYMINPTAYGTQFLLHAASFVDTCGDTNAWTGLADQYQNGLANIASLDLGTTSAILQDTTGVGSNVTNNRVDGFGGCNQITIIKCVMIIPIAISTPVGTDTKVCVAWGAFWVTAHGSGPAYWGQLLSSFNVGVGPESFTWTFGTRASIQIVSLGATS